MQRPRRRAGLGSGHQGRSTAGRHHERVSISFRGRRGPSLRRPRRAARRSTPRWPADEYVVYGKRAPVIREIDRAALRGDLEQRPAPVARDAIADSVRAALADALRSEARRASSASRATSRCGRATERGGRLADRTAVRMPSRARKPRTRPRIYKPFTRRSPRAASLGAAQLPHWSGLRRVNGAAQTANTGRRGRGRDPRPGSRTCSFFTAIASTR